MTDWQCLNNEISETIKFLMTPVVTNTGVILFYKTPKVG